MSQKRVLSGVLVAVLMAAASFSVSSSANAGGHYYGLGYGHFGYGHFGYDDDDDDYVYRYRPRRSRYKCFLPEKYLCGPRHRRQFYPHRYRHGYGIKIRPYYHAYPKYYNYYY
jgi:hypothetical protein